jgi:AcrR family transcriptional regulator
VQKSGGDPRVAVLDAAARLLRDHGIDSVTTRRVAEAAGTQPPTIYRFFGDKNGLLEAVADHVMASYVAAKSQRAADESLAGGDPLDDLRASYRLHVEFGLANPELFTLMVDPRRPPSAADETGRGVLRARVRRLAVAGALRVSEQRAVAMISAAGNGAILCALGSSDRDAGLALGDAMLDAVLGAILTTAVPAAGGELLSNAVSLAAIAPHLPELTDAERQLMGEWLSRSIGRLQG